MQQRYRLLSATALALVLAACASSPARFYTLADTPAATAPRAVTGGQKPLFVDIAPVSMPERLARPQIVVREDGVRVNVLEQDRWSAPFNNELRDALASGVVNRLSAVDVTRGARPSGQPVYRVIIGLRRLDAVRGGRIDADFQWAITRSDTAGSAACRMTIAAAASGTDIAGVVKAMQQVVADTAEAIAADVRMLQEGKSGPCQHDSPR